MLNPKVSNFKKWTNPPSAFQSKPINTGPCGTRWQPPHGICPACLHVPGLCKRKERTDSITPILEDVRGSSGHPKGQAGIPGRLTRGPGSWASLLRKRRQMTMCWAPCKGPCAWGFISLISHASPWGKYYSPHFIRRKFTDHTTVKCEAEVQNQFFPAPEHCLLDGRKPDLWLGLTSHIYIFYLGSGLEMHTSIILIC